MLNENHRSNSDDVVGDWWVLPVSICERTTQCAIHRGG